MANRTNILDTLGRQLDRENGAPLYTQLAHLLRLNIRRGSLRAGEAILPQRQLSSMWNVSEVTVRRAMQTLAQEGLLEARPGSGTVIASPANADSSNDAASSAHRSHRIGIVSAQLTDGYPFLSRMMEQVQSEPDAHIFQFFSVPVNESSLESFRRMLPLGDLDGLLLMSPVNLGLVSLCQQIKLPYVLLYNHIADGMSRCVVVDYMPGILTAVNHLYETGRRKIALVTALESRFSTGLMTDAYHVALQIHKLPINPAWSIPAGYEESQGYTAVKQLLAQADRPDAVLFASDYQARGGLIALQEAGLSAPKDIAIIGAGRMLRDKEWPVPLTTIDLHFEQVGQAAVGALEKLISGDTDVPFRQVVASELIPGETA